MCKAPIPFVACDRKAGILRVQIWSAHQSDVVGGRQQGSLSDIHIAFGLSKYYLEALDTAGFIWFYRSQEKGADDATQIVSFDATQIVSLDSIIGSACLSRPSGELTIATPVNRSTNL